MTAILTRLVLVPWNSLRLIFQKIDENWIRYQYLWVFLAAIFLHFAFHWNVFRATGSEQNVQTRIYFQGDSEDLAVGDIGADLRDRWIRNNGLMGRIAHPYMSQMGLQGLAYHYTCHWFGTRVESCKPDLKVFTSLIFSTALALFAWMASRRARFPAFVSMILLFGMSDWLMLFSNNIYWVAYIQALPFILAWALAPILERGRRYEILTFVTIGGAVALKASTGYEFISNTIASATIPIIYFSLCQGASIRNIAYRFVGICLAGCLGFGLVLMLHARQNAGVFAHIEGQTQLTKEHLNKGYEAIFSRARTRLIGSEIPKTTDPVQRLLLGGPVPDLTSIEVLPLINRYFSWSYLTIRHGRTEVLQLDFYQMGGLLSALFVLTALSLQVWTRELRAFLLTMPLAFLASLSWIFLALPHSYVHIAFNPIIMYIPFLLFFFTWPAIVFRRPAKVVKVDSYSRAVQYKSDPNSLRLESLSRMRSAIFSTPKC